MSFLWTSSDMVAAMNGRPVGMLPEGISGISIDSRSVAAGDAFFAIKGDRFDGHDFASIAAANGARLMVVSEAKLPALGRVTAPMIVVDDVLEALADLGRAARARSTAKIIAVTGSVGKTTSKEMLRQVLSGCGEVHASAASFNNHWGVPLTLARMPESARFGIFEIGMNHPGEIRPLVGMVRPHGAIITTIAAAHLGNFRNLAEIAEAKAEIMEAIEPGGFVLLNRDNDRFAWLKKRATELGVSQIRSFGEHKQAHIRLLTCQLLPEQSNITVRLGNEDIDINVGAPGRHVVQNALAVLGAAWLAGAALDIVVPAFSRVQAAKGRGARHRLAIGAGSFTLIDESYNANPASMQAALQLLRDTPLQEGGRRIAVLGDMLEMGQFSEKLHRGLAGLLQEAGADLVCLAGPEMTHLVDELGDTLPVIYRDTAGAMAEYLVDAVSAGDVVMIKSSLGIGFGRVVKALLDKYPALPDSGRNT
ncbi:UDP-N-acetylmuramoyl-tripeptide--D-alanyl-D-alanine ligase [Hoeflea marina]|uniref:UDP-N-acetylmuramoyl-tripeptide--D-alanyl-D-alanine ligase n=1 Tax=Hoeflea marina TaxID=274592 RepID=A0A317PMF3_9HYPH|nr:UDP-N-acetylmuramoylalanyl-D-glutamyl-2,6-diaminopimelate--D-alanyl-D-alanine ligase [Hoeflea marina]PWV99253.1 UDP-N-acetylmuramoyl-tripeptide--D-alanyl-D-alanine ligase [Hoeflea marina]